MTRALSPRKKVRESQEEALADTVTTTVRMLMSRERITADELAEGAGIPRSVLFKRMAGTTEWRVSEIQRLADFLGVTPAFLVTGFRIDPGPNTMISCSSADQPSSNDPPAETLTPVVIDLTDRRRDEKRDRRVPSTPVHTIRRPIDTRPAGGPAPSTRRPQSPPAGWKLSPRVA